MRLACLLLLLIAACDSSRKPGDCDGPCPQSKIDHVVIIVQENHTFDTYFGKYCQAATASNPTCTDGPNCCEAGPTHEPGGAEAVMLDDTANGAYDPDHTQACELMETHGGAMDQYVTGNTCSHAQNFAYADGGVVGLYWQYAAQGALADHYFQPIAGQSSSNDMYLFRANYVFTDNSYTAPAIGQKCSIEQHPMSFDGPTIGDVLNTAGVSWSWYAEGYDAMVASQKKGLCPKPPADCDFGVSLYPCVYDVGDFPVDYYASFADDPKYLRDYAKFKSDLDNSTLPQVAWVRGLGYHSEHPGTGVRISDGTAFVKKTVDDIEHSAYAKDTLVLVTWDEGGGFFDHIAPPGMGTDNQPYGTRVTLLAVGPLAKANAISHVQMEHSSIVKFIEWNWTSQTGQLAGRDATVANLGSLLDPAATGTQVPE
ncbi:MAG TPA: alkaline phosphatase family protein [Kofleriaceae bacterium]|nr:alkaline phosphatase family protein [Kofleriaceae bacterium]